METESVTLEVEVNKPNVVLNWFKDGRNVAPDDRINVLIEGCVHKVHIKSAVLSDEGLYKVTVGLLISEAPLTVKGITNNSLDYIYQPLLAFFHFYFTIYITENTRQLYFPQ